MNNFDLTKYLAEGKILKEAFYPEFEGETNDKINDIAIAVVDELESKLDSESSGILKGMDYYVGSDGMDNDEVEQGFTKWFIDLVKYLSKNNNEVTISSVEQDDKVFTPAITLKYLDNGKEDISWKIKSNKLNEAMSPQDIVDIADTVAEEFTKEDADGGIFMVYSVGKMDVDDMTFELDTDTTSQTPERILNMSNLGVGEGWGGSFRIKPKGEGYEVRNTEKGGLVAIIDNMGSFKMISNDEAKAEMGRTKGEETDFMQNRKEMDDYAMDENKEIKSNKMTKSKLKEMIKAAMVADTAVYEAEYDSDIENQTEEDFGFWFKAGVKSEKQIQQAKDLLTQNGIEFNAEGRFGIDFQGKGYEKKEIVQLLRDNGLTLFVIYDH